MSTNATSPLISAAELMALCASGQAPVILDCSFELSDPAQGQRQFAQAHLPGSVYAHLERDLSGPKSAAGSIEGGRHPLPDRATWAHTVGQWGIGPGMPVVVLDAQGCAFAGRAWWLLHWLGHRDVRVLDGGLPAWQAAGGAVAEGPAADRSATPLPDYPLGEPGMRTVRADELLKLQGSHVLVDARAGERFRGEVEPLDRIAGHIPGARNRFFKDNLQADGRFKPAAELHAAFSALGVAPTKVIHQCGSGVTACHNLLAMAAAGLPGAALYPGSWSEWCADPLRPVARGA